MAFRRSNAVEMRRDDAQTRVERAGDAMKRIVICMDGTWQNIAVSERLTNVGQIALDVRPTAPDGKQQLVFYSPGIGAETFLGKAEDRIFKGATGEGAEEQIVAAYLFLSLNFAPGDEIYLFGFSRGAFCCRSLAGLIKACGIIKRDHANRVREAFEIYRMNPRTNPEANAKREAFRAAYAIGPVYDPDQGHDPQQTCAIASMGVFDTVVMRGVIRPNQKFTVDKKYAFHDLMLGSHVLAARQALALDERRSTLRPTFWSNLPALNAARGVDPNAWDAPYQQKWFTGAHGDVGGGQSAELSEVSRKWVKRGAVQAGLHFEGETLDIVPVDGRYRFLDGEVEVFKGFLNVLGFADRSVFPEPIDPSMLPKGMLDQAMKMVKDLMAPRSQVSQQDIARLVHVSALLRAFEEERKPAYAPKSLQPLLKALQDPQVRANFLEAYGAQL